jgi:hypothetical protein
MSQPRSLTSPLFRTSLRDWQAEFKAKQAEAAPAPVDPTAPPRVKRLAARKKKKMRDAMLRSDR